MFKKNILKFDEKNNNKLINYNLNRSEKEDFEDIQEKNNQLNKIINKLEEQNNQQEIPEKKQLDFTEFLEE
jgi:proteasome assembly chaperone (PAC2) family protein